MKQHFMHLAFGYLVKCYCQRHDIGYKELSLYADCSESHLARIAEGQVKNPDLAIILRIADCIDQDIRDFFKSEGEGF